MDMRAAGGTSVPLMLDWLMWLSMPNVNAEWEKPEDKTADVHKQKHKCSEEQASSDPNKAQHHVA